MPRRDAPTDRPIGLPRQYRRPRGPRNHPADAHERQARQDAVSAMGRPVLRCGRCRNETYRLLEGRLCPECYAENPNAKPTDVPPTSSR